MQTRCLPAVGVAVCTNLAYSVCLVATLAALLSSPREPTYVMAAVAACACCTLGIVVGFPVQLMSGCLLGPAAS